MAHYLSGKLKEGLSSARILGEKSILSAQPVYDISIWEEIRTIVRPHLDVLVLVVKTEISKDRSLAEFQTAEPVPWQLAQIIEQRGEAWLQRLYEICRNAYQSKGKMPSEDFNRAVWAFCIEPFVMDGDPERILSYESSGLLQLLLCAVGSPPERRKLLKVSQKNCCLSIRAKLWEKWRDRLHSVLPKTNKPGTASANFGEIESNMAGTASTGSQAPLAPLRAPDWESILRHAPLRSAVPEGGSGTKSQKTTSSETSILNRVEPVTWQSVEISFLSDERLQILIGKKRATLNYAEFGFEDGRDGKPNRAWKVLRAMAENRGTIPDGTSVSMPWPSVEKAIQEIRKALCQHFGISDDPIPFVKGVGYQACFRIGCRPSFNT